MRKRRTNLNQVFRGGLLCCALLSAALPGCKKKEVSPPAAEVSPMPKKPVQQNISSNKKAVVAPVAGQPTATQAIPKATPAPAPSAPPGPTGAKPALVKPELQKQVSSSRLSPPPTGISLDFTNRRDPFRPFVQVPTANASGKVQKSVRDALPIQSFDTEKFRVTGIITGVRENSALVVDPNGKGYVVRVGMLLGNNDGRIKKVTNSTVEVEESFKDDNGRVKKRLVKLTLTRKK